MKAMNKLLASMRIYDEHFLWTGKRYLGKTLVILFAVLTSACSSSDEGASPGTNTVSINTVSPESPATLFFGEDVSISYDYDIVDPEGVRIWVQPYTSGAISPKFSYTSSSLFKGKGSKDVRVSITSGSSTMVDQLKVKIASADGKETISEAFETVDYTFVTPSNSVTITTFDPVSPASLTSGGALKMDYKYTLLDVSSIKLDIELLSNGDIVSAAKVIAPLFISGGTSHTGTGGVTFNVTTNSELKIDQIRIFAKNTDNNEVFYESLVDVDYTFTK